VEKLPSFLPGKTPVAGATALPMTGTDGKGAPVCIGFAQPAATGLQDLRLIEGEKGDKPGNSTSLNSLRNKAIDARYDRLIPLTMKAGDGSRTPNSHVGNVALYH